MTEPAQGFKCCDTWAVEPAHTSVVLLPQNVMADSRVVSFYSNATVYQSVPINPTPNA